MVASNTYYSSVVNFQLPLSPDPKIPPAILAAINPLYGAMQQVFITFTNNCGISSQPVNLWEQFATQAPDQTVLAANMGRVYLTPSEDIAFGAMASLWNNAGVFSARNANATNNTKPADCFCITPGGLVAGVVGEFILSCGMVPINGVVAGTRYYLSTVNGLITAVAPVAAGNIEQYLGIGFPNNQFYFNAHYWIQH